jgi:hypothetical protein
MPPKNSTGKPTEGPPDGKWPARDLPKRGRFLSCDIEAFLEMQLPSPTITEKPKGGRK